MRVYTPLPHREGPEVALLGHLYMHGREHHGGREAQEQDGAVQGMLGVAPQQEPEQTVEKGQQEG
ncbi:MAG: hypothetical protein IJ551_07525 [Prevotella sp.]|nr:hypothetical protein [Prevotella sp.]